MASITHSAPDVAALWTRIRSNALLIGVTLVLAAMILIPIFTYLIYPFYGKFFEPTPLRKIGIGLFLTAGAFYLCLTFLIVFAFKIWEQRWHAHLKPRQSA